MKILGTEKVDPKTHRIRLNAQLLVAGAALLLLRDLVSLRAVGLEVPDAPKLMNWALQGVMDEVRRAGGHKDDYAAHMFLVFDWLGQERFAGLMKTFEACELLEKADKAKNKADQAVQEIKDLRQKHQAGAAVTP
jgi:hypothetical protein